MNHYRKPKPMPKYEDMDPAEIADIRQAMINRSMTAPCMNPNCPHGDCNGTGVIYLKLPPDNETLLKGKSKSWHYVM